ncbi:MAG: HAMP domain-containing sensor histidine kinase [Candidatus Sulfotelmatobacter sp.]
MTSPFFENVRQYALVLGLAGVLALLAVLQYRSTKEVSEATTGQMRASLQGSLMDVRQGLERELTPLCRELQSGSDVPGKNNLQEYLARYERWRRAASHPDLVEDVFVWRQIDSPHPQFLKLNSNRTAFENVDWPSNLVPLRQWLDKTLPAFGAQANGPGRPAQPPDSPGAFERQPASFHYPAPPPGGPGQDRPPDDWRSGSMPRRPPPRFNGRVHSPFPGTPSLPWMIDQNIPALVHPVLEGDDGSASNPPRPPVLTWIVIVLNLDVLGHHILPELVQRYFGSNEQAAYDLAVIGEDAQAREIYSSHAGFSRQQGFLPDAALNLFGRPLPVVGGPQSSSPQMFGPFAPPPQQTTLNRTASGAPTAGVHEERIFEIEPIHYTPDEQEWKIIAKHRQGSVEAAVARLYRRNLIFNFAVLLVLAATMGMIIATSQRARRLGQLQMDFVTSISHELRTPLTGIVSAAQNIADGLIDDKERMARYGVAIVGQAQQLADLVEQILLFSATQKARHRYHLQPVDIASVIDTSLHSMAGLIHSAEIAVQQEIQSGLPPVQADFNALTQCLQNLIANAVKYGGQCRWIGIRATAVDLSTVGQEIKISVEDKGIGITPEELSRIFEPFYRSPTVTAAQIHGSGLGLAIVKSIVEAMGGRLTVESECRSGSTFTIHLPV